MPAPGLPNATGEIDYGGQALVQPAGGPNLMLAGFGFAGMRSLSKPDFAFTGKLETPFGLGAIMRGGSPIGGALGGFMYTGGSPIGAIGGAMLARQGGAINLPGVKKTRVAGMFAAGAGQTGLTPLLYTFGKEGAAMAPTVADVQQNYKLIGGGKKYKEWYHFGRDAKGIRIAEGFKPGLKELEGFYPKEVMKSGMLTTGAKSQVVDAQQKATAASKAARELKKQAAISQTPQPLLPKAQTGGQIEKEISKWERKYKRPHPQGVNKFDNIVVKPGTDIPWEVRKQANLPTETPKRLIKAQAARIQKPFARAAGQFDDAIKTASHMESNFMFSRYSKYKKGALTTRRKELLAKAGDDVFQQKEVAGMTKRMLARSTSTQALMKSTAGLNITQLKTLAGKYGVDITADVTSALTLRRKIAEAAMDKVSVVGGVVKFAKVASVFTLASVLKDIGIAAARGGITAARGMQELTGRLRQLEFGGPAQVVSTEGASTERQRALQALQNSTMNARQFIGQEAALLHS